MKTPYIAVVAAGAFISMHGAQAQEADPLKPAGGSSGGIWRIIGSALSGDTKKLVGEDLLKEVADIKIPGLELGLKAFDTDSGSSLGLNYSYKFSHRQAYDPLDYTDHRRWHNSFAFDLAADGNVAFKKGVNPRDFLNTKASLGGMLKHRGGDPAQAKFDGNPLQVAKDAAKCTTPEIRANQCAAYNSIVNALVNSIGLFSTLHYGATGGVESDQEFKAMQYTYGGYLGLRLWDGRADSTLAFINVFDYPFALIRSATGYDSSFQPSGRSFPTLRVGLDRVSPDKDTPRAKAGDGSDFTRWNFEAAFSTPFMRYDGADLYFTASYRYYREINPSPLVKAANLEDQRLWTLSVGGRKGLFVTYSNGQLPMDAKRDQSIELGWKFHY